MRRLQLPLAVLLGCSIAFCCSTTKHAVAQFRGADNEEVDVEVPENRPSERPKSMIALSIWILKLSESHEDADAELTAKIAAQAENLSPVVGSVSEVRELVGRMRVAGLLRSEREFRLLMLEGGTLEHQSGRHQPRVVATAVDPRRGQTNSIQFEPTGIKVKARAEVDSDGYVEASLEISESIMVKSENVLIAVSGDGGPLYADVITNRGITTSARVKNGDAVLLQRDSAIDAADPSLDATELIILGASIVEDRD
jgi:hypothetical protein